MFSTFWVDVTEIPLQVPVSDYTLVMRLSRWVSALRPADIAGEFGIVVINFDETPGSARDTTDV